jgi:phosphoglycolate phosphatase-like HAD superfamily hydrolase
MTHVRISAFLSGGERSGRLIIFDKDGTLIDFHAMWGGWIRDLAQRLSAEAGHDIAGAFFVAVGFDGATNRVDLNGELAIGTMDSLRACAAEVLGDAGLTAGETDAAIEAAWFIPDPVALARPLADLAALFEACHARGMRVAIATTDDRAPTEATLAGLGLAHLVDALACGDDGHPIKPAPDAILSLCRRLGVAPAESAMVGDTLADMQMGRSAGAGMVVGVLSGIGPPAVLGPHADVLLASVGDLMQALQ